MGFRGLGPRPASRVSQRRSRCGEQAGVIPRRRSRPQTADLPGAPRGSGGRSPGRHCGPERSCRRQRAGDAASVPRQDATESNQRSGTGAWGFRGARPPGLALQAIGEAAEQRRARLAILRDRPGCTAVPRQDATESNQRSGTGAWGFRGARPPGLALRAIGEAAEQRRAGFAAPSSLSRVAPTGADQAGSMPRRAR